MTQLKRTWYTRLLSKTNCPARLPGFHDSLSPKGTDGETQRGLDTSMPGRVHRSLRNWKAHCIPGTVISNLKNLRCLPLKVARSSQLYGSLHITLSTFHVLNGSFDIIPAIEVYKAKLF